MSSSGRILEPAASGTEFSLQSTPQVVCSLLSAKYQGGVVKPSFLSIHPTVLSWQLCTCVCVFTECMCAHVCETQSLTFGVFLSHSPPYVLRQSSWLLNSPMWLACPVSEPQEPSHLPTTLIISMHCNAWFSVCWCQALRSGTWACKASILAMEPLP